MDFKDGPTLTKYLLGGKASSKQIYSFCAQICHIHSLLYSLGLYHADLHGKNIIVTRTAQPAFQMDASVASRCKAKIPFVDGLQLVAIDYGGVSKKGRTTKNVLSRLKWCVVSLLTDISLVSRSIKSKEGYAFIERNSAVLKALGEPLAHRLLSILCAAGSLHSTIAIKYIATNRIIQCTPESFASMLDSISRVSTHIGVYSHVSLFLLSPSHDTPQHPLVDPRAWDIVRHEFTPTDHKRGRPSHRHRPSKRHRPHRSPGDTSDDELVFHTGDTSDDDLHSSRTHPPDSGSTSLGPSSRRAPAGPIVAHHEQHEPSTAGEQADQVAAAADEHGDQRDQEAEGGGVGAGGGGEGEEEEDGFYFSESD